MLHFVVMTLWRDSDAHLSSVNIHSLLQAESESASDRGSVNGKHDRMWNRASLVYATHLKSIRKSRVGSGERKRERETTLSEILRLTHWHEGSGIRGIAIQGQGAEGWRQKRFIKHHVKVIISCDRIKTWSDGVVGRWKGVKYPDPNVTLELHIEWPNENPDPRGSHTMITPKFTFFTFNLLIPKVQ